MKKSIHILVLTIFLSGCTALQNVAQLVTSPTAPPPADTKTPFVSVTPIPTQNLFATSTSTPLTFTPTVTQIGAELFTPTLTETPLPIPTVGLPASALGGNYFTPVNTGFLTVLISNNTMYWNEGPCTPRNIKFSAFVEDPVNIHRVLLFTRLREKKNTLNVTDWNAGAIMIKADNGAFNYDVGTDNIRRYFYYKDAWLEYQLVGVTEDLQIIARTVIYDRNISLVRCQPILSP